jgi:predicted RNA binding protein YcfA (HicA-like mRNA interferase family)
VVVPFHGNDVLHPKIVKQALEAVEETGRGPDLPM